MGGGFDVSAGVGGYDDLAAGGFLYSEWLEGREVFSSSGSLSTPPEHFSPTSSSGNAPTPPRERRGVEVNLSGGDAAFGGCVTPLERCNEAGPASRGSSFWGEVGERVLVGVPGVLVLADDSDLRALLVDMGNGREIDFDEWRRLRGLRVLSDFERLAASAISDSAAARFGFVRRARIDFQSSLGGRKGQLAIDALGALREREDDVLGWHLRGYGGEEKAAGGNAGLFWRVVHSDSLLGANVYLDYEKDDLAGGFWRWSLGGEWKSKYGEIYANRYWAITEGKQQTDGVYVYTREGFDADLYVRVPRLEWVALRAGWYNWAGERGEADEEGLRYGLRLSPGYGLELELEVDEDSGDIGGRFSYAHDFGQPTPGAARTGSFDPRAHFFDAVRREYSQRISRAGETSPFGVNLTDAGVTVGIHAGRQTLTVNNQAVMAFGYTVSAPAKGANESFTAIVIDNARTVTTTVTGDRVPFALTQDVTVTTGAGSGARAFAKFEQAGGAWSLSLGAAAGVEFRERGSLLTVVSGEGDLDRRRPPMPGRVMFSGATVVELGGTRLRWGLHSGAARVTLLEGSATMALNANTTITVAAGARLILTDGTETVVVACGGGDGVTRATLNISGDCGLADAEPPPPSPGFGAGVIGLRIPAEAGATVATVIALRDGANPNFTAEIASQNTAVFGLAAQNSDGVILITVVENDIDGQLAQAVVRISSTVEFSPGGVMERTVQAQVSPSVVLATSVFVVTTRQTAPAAAVVVASGGFGAFTYGLIGASDNFRINAGEGGTVAYYAGVDSPATPRVTVRAEDSIGGAATVILDLRVVDPPDLAIGAGNLQTVAATANAAIVIGRPSVSGGDGNYSFTIGGTRAGVFTAGIDETSGEVSIRALTEGENVAITIGVDDGHANVGAVRLTHNLSLAAGIVLPVPSEFATAGDGVLTVTTFRSELLLGSLRPIGGGGYSYGVAYGLANLIASGNDGGGELRFRSSPQTPDTVVISVFVRGTVNVAGLTQTATAGMTLAIVDPPAILGRVLASPRLRATLAGVRTSVAIAEITGRGLGVDSASNPSFVWRVEEQTPVRVVGLSVLVAPRVRRE